MIKDGQSDEPSSKTDWPAMLFLVVALSTALIYGGIWIGLVTFAVGMILYQRNVVGREPEEARKKCNALEAPRHDSPQSLRASRPREYATEPCDQKESRRLWYQWTTPISRYEYV